MGTQSKIAGDNAIVLNIMFQIKTYQQYFYSGDLPKGDLW